MPKRKANSSRKPPQPGDDHSEIAAWISRMRPELAPVVETLDVQIRRGIPDSKYALKWSRAYYGLPDVGWIIELAAYSRSVKHRFSRRRRPRPTATAR